MRFVTLTLLIANICLASVGQPRLSYLGEYLTDFEVCFYRYDIDDPYSGFEAQSYACNDVDETLETTIRPAAYFFRRADLVSGGHGAFLPTQYAEFPSPRLPRVTWSVGKTATLDLSSLELADDEHWSLIIPAQGNFRLSVYPIHTREQVPADTKLIVARVKIGRPVAISSILRLRPGRIHTLEQLNGSGMFFRVQVEEGMIKRDHLRFATGHLAMPTITLVDSRGTEHRPSWTPQGVGALNGSLYYFANVPEGRATLQSRGQGWKPFDTTVNVSRRLTVVEEQVVLQVVTH